MISVTLLNRTEITVAETKMLMIFLTQNGTKFM